MRCWVLRYAVRFLPKKFLESLDTLGKISYNIYKNRRGETMGAAVAGGCGSVIGGGLAIVMIATLAIAAVILKKVKSND